MPGSGYQFDDDAPAPSMSDLGYDEEPAESRPPLPLTRRQLAIQQPEYYEEQVPQQMENVSIDTAEPPEEDYQEVVSHVDRRLRIAQYYRMILDGSLFNDDTPESKIVQNRIRKFVRDEIEVLFGMKAAAQAVNLPFSAEEIEALKALAAATVAAKRRSAEPKLNRASAPAPVAAQPVLRPVQAPPPQLRQVAPQQPRTVVQPQAVKPKPQAPVDPPGTLQSNVQAGNPSLNGDPRIPDEYRQDPTVRVKNGHVYVQQRNPDGELMWVQETGMRRPIPLLKDVTPVARPVGAHQPVPMPSIESMPMLTNQIAATEAMQNLERLAIKLDPVFKGRIL